MAPRCAEPGPEPFQGSSAPSPGSGRGSGDQETFIVIGETPVARRVCATLRSARPSCLVRHLVSPGDSELASALRGNVAGATVLIRDDVAALRYALALAHLDGSLPLTVTVFDSTIAAQLRTFLPQATVVSPAALAVPSLAGPASGTTALARFRDGTELVEVAQDGPGLREERATRFSRRLGSRLPGVLALTHRHYDPGTRLLLRGLFGLGAILLTDWLWLVHVDDHGVAESFLDASRVVATVGPGATDVGAAYGALSAVAMLLTIVFTAMFTAGLVDRLLGPRLLGLVGTRTVPRSGHVIVVGMGQVGVRLCAELIAQGIPVVGVERERTAPHLTLARRMGVPVVIGTGSDRRLLERLRLPRSRALAAVASDDLDNIAVAVTASAVAPETRVVVRAGEHEAIAETRSLLPLGVIRDVTSIAATFVVATLLGQQPRSVVAGSDDLYLRLGDGRYEPSPSSSTEDCPHATESALGPRGSEGATV